MASRLAKAITRRSKQATSLRTRSDHATGACSAGVDAIPSAGAENTAEGRRERSEAEEDNIEYYKHHKASPLAEIEIADTRKPITRATDGTADSGEGGEKGEGLRKEQMETAEETMMRGARMWKEAAAMRGDPELPSSRVLRSMLARRSKN